MSVWIYLSVCLYKFVVCMVACAYDVIAHRLPPTDSA